MRLYVATALFLMIPLAQGTFQPSQGPDIWREVDLDVGYAKKFINNKLCGKNKTFFTACHEAVKKGLAILSDEKILPATMELDWKMQSFEPDFEQWLKKIDEVPRHPHKSMMYGLMVNKYLGRFDAHSAIVPLALLNQTLGTSTTDTNLKSTIGEAFGRKFALMKIDSFRKGTCEVAETELQILMSVDPAALILDLRDNGGGLNDEALCLYRLLDGDRLPITRKYFSASLLPGELDLRPRKRPAGTENNLARPSTFKKIPLAVLINGKSGSVSEMISAGLQDTHRAWIVGEPTFGKGTFQLTQVLHFHTSLRLMHSVYEIVRAGGAAIQLYGVSPNFTVASQAAAPVLREKDLFPSALKPSTRVLWKEDRKAEHTRLQKCAGPMAAQARADHQQAFAMAVLHCSLKNQSLASLKN